MKLFPDRTEIEVLDPPLEHFKIKQGAAVFLIVRPTSSAFVVNTARTYLEKIVGGEHVFVLEGPEFRVVVVERR